MRTLAEPYFNSIYGPYSLNSNLQLLLNCNKISNYFKLWRMVTAHKKWVTYDHVKRKRNEARIDDQKGFAVCAKKRPDLANKRGIVFHQDNIRRLTSILTRQKFW